MFQNLKTLSKWEYNTMQSKLLKNCMYSLPEARDKSLKHNMNKKLKILVTGGAGFIGRSWLMNH